MVARFLVTTAIEDTWPTIDVPILFLGEWCRIYDRKSTSDKYDSKVVPYHWDDRRKLHSDYLYLEQVYESSLLSLSDRLNQIHNCDNSVHYWRILVGPWLGFFVQMLFDRWFMLQRAISNYDILGVKVIARYEGELLPNDMAAFQTLFVDDDWNEMIYSHLLTTFSPSIDFSTISSQTLGHRNHNSISSQSKLQSVKRNLAKQASFLLGILTRNDENFFINSYLGIKADLLLQAKLGQLPKLWRSIELPSYASNVSSRQWKLEKNQSFRTDIYDTFHALLLNLIPKHLPIAYLEGYAQLVELTSHLQWPTNPKVIFTSNSYLSDDVFKAWTAEKVCSGTPLIIGQHGGNYGMSRCGFTEEHQLRIADSFITWGWSDKRYKNITPMAILKAFSRKPIKPLATGNALLVENAFPRYSYHMYSAPVSATQWQSYFDDQCVFVRTLPSRIRELLLVRLYISDYGHNQRQRWNDCFPSIKLDDGSRPLSDLIAQARIYISTYNATTYLESLSMNFPTIIFWNQDHWELRDEVQLCFDKLKSVGIYHETAESAAEHMVEVWDDVCGWWYREDVQSAVLEFCEHFARPTDRPILRMSNFLLAKARS
jgi:putative transferase (TIGR04331 family)